MKPRIVQFNNGQYGVQVGRCPKTFADACPGSSFTWSSDRHIKKWAMIQSLERAEEVLKEYLRRPKEIKIVKIIK